MKLFIYLFLILFNLSYSVINIIDNYNTWESCIVLNEWGEPSDIKLPKYYQMKIEDIGTTIPFNKVSEASEIVYISNNNKYILPLYKRADDVEINTKFNRIKETKIRFDKNKVVKVNVLKSIELGWNKDEITGELYKGSSKIYLELTDNIIEDMKDHNEMDVIIPYFKNKYIVNIKLKGFIKSFNTSFQQNN